GIGAARRIGRQERVVVVGPQVGLDGLRLVIGIVLAGRDLDRQVVDALKDLGRTVAATDLGQGRRRAGGAGPPVDVAKVAVGVEPDRILGARAAQLVLGRDRIG